MRIHRFAAILTGAAFICATAVFAGPNAGRSVEPKKKEEKVDPAKIKETVLQFKVKDIDGKEVDLGQYYGKVVLIVNTASKCGYTPQYSKLNELYEKYGSQGFVVLGFPCNDFGSQEPGTDKEIKQFCSEKYAINFPMFSKVKVKGPEACEVYKYLTSKETDPKFSGEIKWNFTKFLLDRQGHIVGRYKSSDDPLKCKDLIENIEKSLAAKSGSMASK